VWQAYHVYKVGEGERGGDSDGLEADEAAGGGLQDGVALRSKIDDPEVTQNKEEHIGARHLHTTRPGKGGKGRANRARRGARTHGRLQITKQMHSRRIRCVSGLKSPAAG
jgi:hypothetical protein